MIATLISSRSVQLLAVAWVVAILFDLTGSQVLLGLPLTFAIYLFGTDIPVMVFLILHSAAQVPKAVGFEYWTVYDTLNNSILSVLFVFFQFTVPGMV